MAIRTCRYCERDGRGWFKPIVDTRNLFVDIVPRDEYDGPELFIVNYNNAGEADVVDCVPIRCCPMCGRRL